MNSRYREFVMTNQLPHIYEISEVEDELVNKEQITVKALQVLCLVYNVSVTYIYGKKYCSLEHQRLRRAFFKFFGEARHSQ